MALRVAVANGNWSNPSTWYLGVKPAVGDVVASNGFTVTIDEDVNVDLITNTAQLPISIIPLMTSNTTPEGVASSNNIFGAAYDAFKAFDRSIEQAANHWLTGNNPVLPWLEYQFSTPKVIKAYSLQNNYNNLPNTWQFQAWDGSSWVVLDTVSGNTSNNYQTKTFTNTTAYSKYRIYITVVNGGNVAIGELRMFDVVADATTSVAGGRFILNDGITLTCTNTTYGLLPGSTNVPFVSYSGSGTATINAIAAISPSNVVTSPTINYTGTGTLNINGTLKGYSSQSHNGAGLRTLVVAGTGTVNIIGNIEVSYSHDSPMITMATVATVNHTGDIYTVLIGGNNGIALFLTAGTWTTTGNITGGTRSSLYQVNISGSCRFFHIGTIFTNLSGLGVIFNSSFAFLTSIMICSNLTTQPCLVSNSSSAINILSGPFVCNNYGFMPFQVVRMHLIPTTNSYFEFRDETTNGAISPGEVAPATQLVSPATIADNPISANVRFGTVYSLGTQTGTLHMPHPNQVSYGIPVDNTFGNAVLSMSDIWNVQSSTLTTNGSIGQRLKNASTVESTGDQLSAFS
jgi:hypothetical protein